MFDFFNVKKRVNNFINPFIRFRLYLNFVFAIGFSFALPVSTALKGLEFQNYLWLIPFFSLIGIILSKYTEFFVEQLSLQFVHKILGALSVFTLLTPFIYNLNHFLAAIYLSIVVTIDGLFFNVYSVFLTNYITKINPSLISKYQTTKIHVWADGALIGGLLALFIMGNDNILGGMVAASVIDGIIVLMFIDSYKHLRSVKEEEYKIKEKK